MRLVLECHSHIVCFDEPRAYQELAQNTYDLRAGKTIAGFKIPRWTEQLDELELSDYGLGIEARRFYEREPIIFMLRDVRCVCSSS